jgi:hypothetical protein
MFLAMFPSGWQVAENIQWRFNYPFLQITGLPQAIFAGETRQMILERFLSIA